MCWSILLTSCTNYLMQVALLFVASSMIHDHATSFEGLSEYYYTMLETSYNAGINYGYTEANLHFHSIHSQIAGYEW